MKYDLHIHSCYSHDGELTPRELIKKSSEAGINVISLCDHNDVKGIDEIIKFGQEYDIQVIPGIELSTMFEGLEVHLLGYGIDYHKSYFQTISGKIRKMMDEVLYERVIRFERKYNIKIDVENCIQNANGNYPFYKIVDSMILDPANKHIEDFKDYLPGGKRSVPRAVNFYWDKCQPGSDLYVPVRYPDFEESVKIIHDAGGIAILAHPWKKFYKNEGLLIKAQQAGIDGIEAYSNYHEPEHNRFYEEYCKKNNLLITCGSDFHGMRKPNIQLGSFGCEEINQDKLVGAFINRVKF